MSALVAAASGAFVALGATAGSDPSAGVVLEDGSGPAWRLDELRGAPVLLVIADPPGVAAGERVA